MKIYHVTERITDTNELNAEGYYSTLSAAKQAVHDRIAEVYLPEEMKHFVFDEDNTMVTEENEELVSCTYKIEDYSLDEVLC